MEEFIDRTATWSRRVAELRTTSQYWPSIEKKYYDDGTVMFSTLIRITRYGQWYSIHCVEAFNAKIPGYSNDFLYERIIRSVHSIQTLYKVGSYPDEMDNLQISEEERLTKQNKQ